MKITIIAASGAIGGLITCHFLDYFKNFSIDGITLTLVFNNQDSLDRVKNHGYCLKYPGGKENFYSSIADYDIKLVCGINNIDVDQDLIISVVPAYVVTKEYASLLKTKLSHDREGKILLAHNGRQCWFQHKLLGKNNFNKLQEEIASTFGKDNLLGGVVYLTASIINPNDINKPVLIETYRDEKQGMHLIIGQPYTADHNVQLELIADILGKVGISIIIKNENELALEMLKKLQINMTINPLSALTQKNISQLLKDKICFHIMFMIAEECRYFFEKLGYKLLSFDMIVEFLKQIENHICSMAIHFREGKRLEHESILATLVDDNNKKSTRTQFFNDNNSVCTLLYTSKMFELMRILDKMSLEERKNKLKENQLELENIFYGGAILYAIQPTSDNDLRLRNSC